MWRAEKVLKTNYVLNSALSATNGTAVMRTNLCINPQSANSNDGSKYPTAIDTSVGRSEQKSVRGDLTTAGIDPASNPGNAIASMYGVGGITPGKAAAAAAAYTFSCYMSTNVQGASGVASMVFRGADGKTLGSTQMGAWTPLEATSGNTWTRLSVTAVAPAGTVDVYTGCQASKPATSRVTQADHVWVCDPLFEQRTSVLPYFSGGYGQEVPGLTVAWSGTANASASTATGNVTANRTHNGNFSAAYTVTENGEPFSRCVYNAPANNTVITGSYLAVQPQMPAGPYTYSVEVRASADSAVGKQLRPALYAQSDTTFLTKPNDQTQNVTLTNQWQRLTVHSVTDHSGRGTVLPYLYQDGILPTQAYTADYDLRRPVLTQGVDEPVWFTGNTPSVSGGISYRWNGAVSASTSDMYLAALMSPTGATWSSYTSGYAESWRVDGIDIQSAAFGIEKVDSVPPEMRGDHTTLPNANGVLPRFNRSYEPGSLTLKMWVLGCDTDGSIPQGYTDRRQYFERNYRMLMRLFGYQGNTVMLQRWYVGDTPNGPTGTWVTARAMIHGITGFETMMARQRAELTVAFALVDAFWSDILMASTSSTTGTTMPHVARLPDPGTAPIDDAILSIVGPISYPRIMCESSGSWIQYNDVVAAGQTLLVDSGKGTAVINGKSVMSGITHGGTARLMVIPPREGGTITETSFTPSVKMTGTNAGSTTGLTVSYFRKHLVMV